MRIKVFPQHGSGMLLSLLAGFLVLQAMAGIFLAEVTVHPERNVLTSGDEAEARRLAQHHDSEVTDVAIAAKDGVLLRAWSIRPHNTNGNAVILLHGLGNNRVGMSGYAELLLGRGFNVLMPDARAHGASGGNLATFGLLESEDIHRWLDWLEQNNHPVCIFGLGESMGGALLLESARSETRFCALIAESPFASFREIGYDRVGQRFHTGFWLGQTILRPIVEFAFVYARWKYELDFEQVSPESAVAATKIPVFLIHGAVDSNIPVRHSRLIVAHNSSIPLWEVPNADHCGAISTAPDEFVARVFGWFASHGGVQSNLAVRLIQ